jgi:hypothetical protein
MDSSDYAVAWIIYGLAGAVFGLLAWRVLSRYLPRTLAYFLECVLLALMFTPAYVLPDQGIMAPALMVVALDALTIEPKAAIRALIPLVLALLLALAVATVLSVIHRLRSRRPQTAQTEPDVSEL